MRLQKCLEYIARAAQSADVAKVAVLVSSLEAVAAAEGKRGETIKQTRSVLKCSSVWLAGFIAEVARVAPVAWRLKTVWALHSAGVAWHPR